MEIFQRMHASSCLFYESNTMLLRLCCKLFVVFDTSLLVNRTDRRLTLWTQYFRSHRLVVGIVVARVASGWMSDILNCEAVRTVSHWATFLSVCCPSVQRVVSFNVFCLYSMHSHFCHPPSTTPTLGFPSRWRPAVDPPACARTPLSPPPPRPALRG